MLRTAHMENHMNAPVMTKCILWIAIAALWVFSPGCELDIYKQDGYVEEYVVEIFLIADHPFPQLRLSRTAPIHEAYDFTERAVNDASAVIHELDAAGNRITQIMYRQSAEPGIYDPVSADQTVKSGTRYRLEIADLPDPDAFISSETFVPQSFEIVQSNRDSLMYQGPVQFEIIMTRGEYPGRQNIYVFTTEALDTVNYPLTPLYAEFADEENFQLVSSPALNEGNYSINPDGTITLRLPWLMIAYLGPNRISAYAIDDNIFDFYRSAEVQLGGSTLSPGQIENVINHIDGGIGIFGGMAGVRLDIYVSPAN
jgi:hypothetical protein